MTNDIGRSGGLVGQAPSPDGLGHSATIPSAFWPFRITNYAPSHRQFRLSEELTPKEITAAIGAEPTKMANNDKVTLEWQFWAELTYALPTGGFGTTSTCCKVWDYCDSRWSAYGWPEAFEQIGLKPLLTKDYGDWQYHEDGNPTLHYLSVGLAQAIETRRAETFGSVADESAVAEGHAPNEPPHAA